MHGKDVLSFFRQSQDICSLHVRGGPVLFTTVPCDALFVSLIKIGMDHSAVFGLVQFCLTCSANGPTVHNSGISLRVLWAMAVRAEVVMFLGSENCLRRGLYFPLVSFSCSPVGALGLVLG